MLPHVWEVKLSQNSSKRAFNIIKRRFLIYLVIIIIGLIAIFSISLYSGETLKNDSKAINILGKQRMITQALSKNASRISVISDALTSNNSIQSSDVLEKKLLLTKYNLQTDAAKFKLVYDNLSRGFVQLENENVYLPTHVLEEISSELSNIKLLWPKFESSIHDVTTFEVNTVEFKNALIYINENNESLLMHTDLMVNEFEHNMLHQYDVYRNITLFLIGLVVLITSFLMYQMYSDLFKALNVFYKQIDKLGLEHDHAHFDIKGKEIADEVESMFIGFSETLELTEKINTQDSFIETLNYIYKSFNHFLPYSYIGIALIDDHKPVKVVASYGISENKHNGLSEALLGQEVILSETSLEQIMVLKEPRIINDIDKYFEGRPIKAYSKIILEHGIKASITLPLEANGIPLGFIFFSSDRKNVYHKKHVEYLKIISNSIALSFQKNIFVDDLVYSSVLALAKLSEARDEDTGDHLMRMSRYSGIIAKALKDTPEYNSIITNEYVTDIIKFSPMHDIGKVGIPDRILLKPGKLTFEEFEIMKTHTAYGANVLAEAEQNIKKKGRSLFKMGIEIAQNHHEKYDGTGYPNGLIGDEIPLSARIVTVADVFDALLSKRPYKEPFTLEETLKIIRDGKGKHFDPVIVDALLSSLDELNEVRHGFL